MQAGNAARALQGQFSAPHTNTDVIEGYFRNEDFPNMMDLMAIVDGGVPVDVTGSGDLESALKYRNHASATSTY